MVAKNRYGVEFMVHDIVYMSDFPVLYPQMKDQKLRISEIVPWYTCESGFMIQVIHQESGKPFKSKLDTNWFKKTN